MIFFGWSSMVAIAIATYARKRFRACVKKPASYSINDSDTWEAMVTFWNLSGLAMAGASILCCGLWVIL
jgi:hypothetical protein